MPNGWTRKTASWSNGSTGKWRKVRKAWLAEHPLCEWCGALAGVVDHLDGTDYATQRYDRSTFRSLCTSCHDKRTAAQGHAALGHRDSVTLNAVSSANATQRRSREW